MATDPLKDEVIQESEQGGQQLTTQTTSDLPNEKKNIDNNGKVVSISKEDFINQIWDYQKNPNSFVFKGQKPAIIDFYADWCRPCKMVAPIMDELAKEYNGKINIYKVDTDDERELAQVFRIQGIPSMLFVPVEGMPQMTTGAFAKDQYVEYINEIIYAKN
jgi:thioredoxin